jgi:hypothetical protein
MKIKLLFLIAVLLATVIGAGAIPINLGQTTGSPASFANDLSRLNVQITAYNSLNTPALPTAVSAGGIGPISATGTSIVLDVTGWTYLSLKWADTDQFYYVGNDSGDLTFNSTVFNGNGQPQNLSGYDFFNPVNASVPDGGLTVVMLGAVLFVFWRGSSRPEARLKQ